MTSPPLIQCKECENLNIASANKCTNSQCPNPNYPLGVMCIYCGQMEKYTKAIKLGNNFSHKTCYERKQKELEKENLRQEEK